MKNILDNFKEFVAIDIETTGLSSELDSIIQIGAIKFNINGDVIDKYERFFYPQNGIIPEESSKINGIYIKDVDGYPRYKDIGASSKIKDFCNGFPLIGHNILGFDIKFLNFECVNIPKIFDTQILFMEKFSKDKRNSLKRCCSKVGIKTDGIYHTALYDAEQSMRLFLHLAFMVEQTSMYFTYNETKPVQISTIKWDNNKKEDIIKYNNIYKKNNNLIIPFDSPIENHWWKATAKKEINIKYKHEKKTDKYGRETILRIKESDFVPMHPDINFLSFEDIIKKAPNIESRAF